MFNFKNLEAIKNIDWKGILNEQVPKDTTSMIDDDDYQDILSGIIGSIILHIVIIINITLLSSLEDLLIASISFINFLPLVALIGILVYYIYIYKNSKGTNGLVNYVITIFTIVYSCGLLLYALPWFGTLFSHLIATLVSLASIGGIIVSNLFILIGTLGYAKKINDENHEAHRDLLDHPNIKLTRIESNDVADHSFKYCSKCGEKNEKDSNVCSRCGNML